MLIGLVALLGVLSAALGEEAIPVPSVWELVDIPPVAMMDSSPNGMPNVREYYTEDGRLCFLDPFQTSGDDVECAKVTVDGKFRVAEAGGKVYVGEAVHLDATSMRMVYEDGSWFEFRRLDDDAHLRPIRPESLHVLQPADSDSIPVVEYVGGDTPDSIPETLDGVWEIIAYLNLPAHDWPPYGFPNQKWVISPTHITQVMPGDDEILPGFGIPYTMSDDVLMMGDMAVAVRYDQWGDLRLTTSEGEMLLRRVSQSATTIPIIPRKAALILSTHED